MRKSLLLLVLIGATSARAQVTLSDLLGTGSAGYQDGPAATAKVHNPRAMAKDDNGLIYFADAENHCIRVYDPDTDEVSTLAGSGFAGYQDGTGTAAQFNTPFGIVFDPNSGDLFVTDALNYRIRRVTTSGVVTTIAGSSTYGMTDGTGSNAQFWGPYGIDRLSNGDLVVVDRYNHAVRKVTTNGVVTTIAGNGSAGYTDGPASNARFYKPQYLTVLNNDDILVTDFDNHVIRKISGGTVSTFAGSSSQGFIDGPLTNAKFSGPVGISSDMYDNVYVTDFGNHAIRFISNGMVTTLAGNGSSGYNSNPSLSCLDGPHGIFVDPDAPHKIYFSDWYNQRVRIIEQPNVGLAENLASEGGLGQNFPNPVSGKTTIPFELAFNAEVQIEIWSLTGQRLHVVEKGTLPGGHHEVELNIQILGLASGTYLTALIVRDENGGVGRSTRLMTVTP